MTQFFAALNDRDWKRLARLCTPEVRVASLATPAISAGPPPSGLLTYRAAMGQRFLSLPGYTIEQVQVYGRPLGLAARPMIRWQSSDGVVHRVAGSMQFRFLGAHISVIETWL